MHSNWFILCHVEYAPNVECTNITWSQVEEHGKYSRSSKWYGKYPGCDCSSGPHKLYSTFVLACLT